MKNLGVIGVAVFSILTSACATTSSLRTISHEQIRLQDETHEFYKAWLDKNSEKIWQLSSPFIKNENRKEEYTANIDLFLRHMIYFSYHSVKVVYMSKKLAVTQAVVGFTFQDEVLKEHIFSQCERIVWLRFPEGWRFDEPNRVCTYMPDKDRIEFLTKNIPD